MAEPPSIAIRTRLSRSGQAGFLALSLLLAGCGTAAAPTSAELAQRLSLTAEQSEAAFAANFAADRQPAAQSWQAVLRGAESAQLSAVGRDRLEFTYRLPGDRRASSTELAFQLQDGRISLLNPTDGLTPIWLLPDVQLSSSGSATLLSAGLTSAEREAWQRRIQAAGQAVAELELAPDWQPALVVVVPPAGAFAKVSGEPADSASAVTRCDGGTPRILINPAVLRQPAAWLDSTVVHEAVHVATDSACQDDSLAWVVEGLAESVAAATDPATAKRNRELVRDWLATNTADGLPTKLNDLTDYALAQLAVEQLQAHLGDSAASFWQVAIQDPDSLTEQQLEQATNWYLAELERRRPG